MDTFRRTLGLQPAQEPHQSLVRPLYPDLRALQRENDGQVHRTSVQQDAADEMRQKMRSMWHSVKYGRTAWSLDGDAVSRHSPVWIMGRSYDRRREGGRAADQEVRRIQ